jgi:hypothetical protein
LEKQLLLAAFSAAILRFSSGWLNHSSLTRLSQNFSFEKASDTIPFFRYSIARGIL